jgi:ribosome modulation factor
MSLSFMNTIDAETARQEGFAAARNGQSFRLCPYGYRTELRTAWLDGYRLAVNPIIPTTVQPSNAARPSLNFRTAVSS